MRFQAFLGIRFRGLLCGIREVQKRAGLDGEGRVTHVTADTGQNPVTSVNYTPYGTAGGPENSAWLTGNRVERLRVPHPFTFLVKGAGFDFSFCAANEGTFRLEQYQFNVNGQSDTGALSWNANSTLRQLAISDALPSSTDSQTCAYGYDDLVRVTSANCGTVWSQTFTFDPFGNIAKNGSIMFQPTYDITRNRIVTVGSSTATYDGNGNATYDTVHHYTWDANGNSITVDNSIGITYDAMDRAVEQNRSGSYTQMVYTPGGAKLALMNGQTLQKGFVPLPGQATALYTSTGLDHYRHADWLGNARMTSTPARTVAATVAYAPFGETYAPSQTGTPDPSFTGQNSDTVSDDYDFMAREYNSTQGRWTSPDPAGTDAANPMNPQSWNRYAYVLNNPLEFVDPLGLDCRMPSGLVEDGSTPEGSSPAACEIAGGRWVAPASGGSVIQDFRSIFTGDWTWNFTTHSGGGKKAWTQKYNQCVKDAGVTLKVADAVGVWGLGSTVVSLGTTGFTKGMQWVYGTTAANISKTVAQQAPTATTEGILATAGEHALFWEGTWATVGKVSGYITIGGTSVSAGVRGYCAAKASF